MVLRSALRSPRRRWSQTVTVVFLVGWGIVLWCLHNALDHQESQHKQHYVIQLPKKKPSITVDEQDAKKKPGTLPTLTRPHVRPSSDYVTDTLDLWEQPTEPPLPEWTKDYFRWLKETQRQQQSSNLKDKAKIPYLLLACPKGSRKCGGTVDRLSPLVFLLYVASRTHRRLIIHWGRPAPLEEFLVPPAHGVDWRLDPDEIMTPTESVLVTTLETLLEATDSPHQVGVRCRYQAPDHGAGFYNAHRAVGEPTMAQITRPIWELFFTPAPPVAERIQTFLTQNGLVPHRYLGAHIRALYAVSDQDPYLVQYWTYNAVNCTTELARDMDVPATLFVASDASVAPKLAQRYGKQHGWKVVFHAPDVGPEPLHLDKASHWQDRPPSDFYDAFVDLYLLGLARCLTYGVGGYGRFASWLTGNPSCALQHHNATAIRECTLVPPQETGMSKRRPDGISESLFRPPMGTAPENRQLSTNKVAAKDVIRPSDKVSASTEDGLPTFPDTKRDPPLENLWEASTILPRWMKEYFAWHHRQKQLIHAGNWREFRYLVVECSRFATKCGGTSDRLRPIPYYIRVANLTKRILLIHWHKPKALESFLLPPIGGMDWRTPEWLVERLERKSITAVKNLPTVASRRDVLIQARIQAHDHGSHYYDNSTAVLDGEGPLAFRRHYHDCWYVLFTPVPAIASMIESELRASGLRPGTYGVAHVRALYQVEIAGRDPAVTSDWTKKAINCLSNLRPGPYFVASDSHDARQVAVEYGREKNVQIVARTQASVPVHMDIAEAAQDLSSLYDVFVDLYLLSFGRCLSYNMGGFGKWAQLLSGHDFTCNVRYWTKGVNRNTATMSCAWNQSAALPESSEPNGDVFQAPLFLLPMTYS